MSKPFHKELVLERSDINTQVERYDKTSLAQMIQNLLFIEKGTYPNQPNLGIGIENYLFEKMSDTTLNTLKEEIKDQINYFCPSDYFVETIVEKKTTNGKLPVLLISFSIKDRNDMTDTRFGILIGKSEKTQRTISKLII